MEPGIFISDDEYNTQVPEVITEYIHPSVPNNDQRSIIEEPQASTTTSQEPQLTAAAEVTDLDNNELDSSTLALLGEDPTSNK